MPGPLTYLQFHALFVIPVLGLLVVAAALRRPRGVDAREGALGFLLIAVLAVVYTTPWDRYLIDRGAWSYGTGRVAHWVVGVPLGELLFFVLQPALTALWALQVAGPVVEGVRHSRRDRVLGAIAGLAVSAVGLLLLFETAALYLGTLLVWAGPVLAVQWAVGWRYLLAVRRRVAIAVAVPTLYLCAVDRYAIDAGIWTIAEQHTIGLTVAGLPVEEIVFFLATTLFVVQGLVLFRWVVHRWR